MPAHIDSVLNTGTPAEIAGMLLARLRGAHYDAPFDRTMGEGPEDYLLSTTFSATPIPHDRASRLTEGLVAVAESNVLPLFAASPSSPDDRTLVDALPWLLPYFRLAAHVDDRRLHDLHLVCLDRLRIGQERTPAINRAYSELASLLLPRLESNPWRIAEILSALLAADTDSAHQFALAAASQFPVAFSKGALRICTELALQGITPANDFVPDIIRELLNAARSKLPKAAYQAVVHELRSLLVASVASERTAMLRDVILAGAERSGIPATDILHLEQCHWIAATVSDPAVAPEFDGPRRQIRDRLRRAFHNRLLSHGHGRTLITMNEIPYAEAAYFQLLHLLSAIDDDVHLELRPVAWSRVGSELFAGRLDIAVHNEAILTHPSPTPDQRRVRRSKLPAFEYRDYVVLITTKRLRSLLTQQHANTAVRHLLAALLEGERVTWEQDDIDGALRAVFGDARIAVQDHTDLYVAFEDFLRELGGFKLDSLSVDDLDQDHGLERLLDGKVDVYIGGAIHSHYALSAFPGRVRVLFDRVGESSACYLFSTADYFKSNRDLVERVAGLWGQAVWMWNQLLLEDQDNGRGAYYEAVRRYLVRQVNCSQSITAAFARSFDDLVRLSRRHNVLTHWEPTEGTTWVSQQLKKLPSPSAQRSVSQRALKESLTLRLPRNTRRREAQ